MKRFISTLGLLGLMAGMVSAAGFDEPKGWDNMYENDLKVTVFAGIFQGGDVATGVIGSDGEASNIRTDNAPIYGIRLGKESTVWGWEVSLAGVFADENETNIDGISTGSASWYLLNADLMLYPFWDDFANGTVRPYVCTGPGVAYYSSDSEVLDSNALFDWNVGTGTAIVISESLPELRIDYRWHFVGGSEYDRSCFNELTFGACFQF